MSTQRVSKHISYAGHEMKILKMEDHLMDTFMCNRSDLHKKLIKEKYQEVTLV